MSKKLTYEYVKGKFEEEGYKLLSNEYIGAHSKLDYVCPNGHKHSITWADWQKNIRCSYCSGKVKKTIEFIKKEFEKENCILLTGEYKNNYSKLNYICSKRHKHSITWNAWLQGKRCLYCVDLTKYSIKFIKKEFEKEGYILLTKKYKNNKQKLDYICPEDHRHSISWANWQQGRRCPTCYHDNNFGKNHPSWKGGISCEPYCDIWLDKDFKQSIKDRDGNKCLNPDCWKNCDHLPLHIHHIDDNKKNCNPRNLITICNSCNSRAQKDREWHTDWYQAIMYRRKTNGCNIYKCK